MVQGDISDLAINPENTLLASADNSQTIRIWDFISYHPIAVLSVGSGITFIGFSPAVSQSTLISTDETGVCRLWNVEDFSKDEKPLPTILQLGAERCKIICCAISKGGTKFITCGDPIIRIWSVNPPQCVGNLVGHVAPVRSVQWSNSSDRVSISVISTSLLPDIVRFRGWNDHNMGLQQWRDMGQQTEYV